jgi:hypothetical protein
MAQLREAKMCRSLWQASVVYSCLATNDISPRPFDNNRNQDDEDVMLGVAITPFVVVKRDGREIGNRDNMSLVAGQMYTLNISSQRGVSMKKVKWMGDFPTVMSL